MARDVMLETGVAAAALALAALIAFEPRTAAPTGALALCLAVIWISWSDVRDFTIPDGANFALGALALGVRFASDGFSSETALLALGSGALCGAALWGVREIYYRLRGHDGLGFGDVKLAAAAGVLVGPAGFALALFAASLAGLAVALALRSSAEARLPLGALLAPAVLAVWGSGLEQAADLLA
ncbi:prepilin peptidase [Chenggangzhangella methanolivorans]|uniref:A24 family peptidase n=1 Tax=Chenggangzhangella methanolivorans TaxID=1437009 RepID=A0A9E6RBN0_9HYPH|nr:A24 family peptidase [Chenggangzhangella methanolivorans]QZO01814.1 A24 family peptidase [Chenggangzhangella methanolivorans]